LLFVSSPATPRGIKALAVHGDFTFAASGAIIHAFRRGKEIAHIGPHSGNVSHLLTVGDCLFAYSADGHVVSYDVKTREELLRVDLAASGVTAKASRSAAKITAWLHPTTYLNKLLLGDEEGSLFILNVRSGKCVHRFAPMGASITVIAQSPAVDVVAVGLSDGRIVVRNIKFDETLYEFKQTDGAVTDLSFRTDNTSILASGSSNGGVYMWDLEDERLIASMPQAHDSLVCTCAFLQGEPILLTSGGDNALKMWIFDQDDGSARLLRSRTGHSAPPTRVRYYSQHTLLSAGQDRSFRIFSTIQDQQSREMSQGKIEKKAKGLNVKTEELKLNPVIDFAAAPLREKDWNNVITCHQDDNNAYTWIYKNAVLGKHKLRPPALNHDTAHKTAMGEQGPKVDPFKRGPDRLPGQVVDYEPLVRKKGAPAEHEMTRAKTVCMSSCGNFGVVGYACGRIDKYNMQSGAHRGTYWAKAPHGHSAAIHGLDISGTLNPSPLPRSKVPFVQALFPVQRAMLTCGVLAGRSAQRRAHQRLVRRDDQGVVV
jgi:U3 small nucleolar RNA-associated protein 21